MWILGKFPGQVDSISKIPKYKQRFVPLTYRKSSFMSYLCYNYLGWIEIFGYYFFAQLICDDQLLQMLWSRVKNPVSLLAKFLNIDFWIIVQNHFQY